jgi:hypothetical protein
MSEQTKDFAHYAEQAENQLQLSLGHEADGTRLLMDGDTKTRHVMRAQVYATLATAAPKPEPASKSQFFYFVNGERVEGQRCFGKRFNNPLLTESGREQCVRLLGHDGDHETESGDRFDG